MKVRKNERERETQRDTDMGNVFPGKILVIGRFQRSCPRKRENGFTTY